MLDLNQKKREGGNARNNNFAILLRWLFVPHSLCIIPCRKIHTFIFQLVTLDPNGINERFDEFIRISTLPSQLPCPRYQTHKNPNSSIRSDEGLTLQTSALKSFSGINLTLVVKNTKFSSLSLYRPRRMENLANFLDSTGMRTTTPILLYK